MWGIYSAPLSMCTGHTGALLSLLTALGDYKSALGEVKGQKDVKGYNLHSERNDRDHRESEYMRRVLSICLRWEFAKRRTTGAALQGVMLASHTAVLAPGAARGLPSAARDRLGGTAAAGDRLGVTAATRDRVGVTAAARDRTVGLAAAAAAATAATATAAARALRWHGHEGRRGSTHGVRRGRGVR